MSLYESTIIFENQPIKTNFNQYQIQINYYLDKIYFKIENNYIIYESFYTLEYLQNFQLLKKKKNSNYTIDEMIKFIKELINQKKIKIEKNDENNLKLILI